MSIPTLSARLDAVVRAVPNGHPLADIGTDHASVPIHCVHHGLVSRAIAVDVAHGPLQAAQRAIETSGVRGIELRRGSGLEPLAPGEVATVVMTGMGGPLIRRLVDARPDIIATTERLVLSPNTQWGQTRRWLAEHTWSLDDEVLVEDAGKFYVALVVRPRPGAPPTWTDADLLLGPGLRLRRGPTFERYRRALRAQTTAALAKLIEHGRRDDPRRAELERILEIA